MYSYLVESSSVGSSVSSVRVESTESREFTTAVLVEGLGLRVSPSLRATGTESWESAESSTTLVLAKGLSVSSRRASTSSKSCELG